MATLDLSWRSFAYTHNELKKAELLGRPSADGAVTQNLGALVAGLLWFKQPTPETNKMLEERQTVELKRGKLSVDTSRRKATAELSQLLVGVDAPAFDTTAAGVSTQPPSVGLRRTWMLSRPICCSAEHCQGAPAAPHPARSSAQRRRSRCATGVCHTCVSPFPFRCCRTSRTRP